MTIAVLIGILSLLGCSTQVQRREIADTRLIADMSESARRFLSSLSVEQQARLRFAFDDAERLNWHYIPRPRQGVRLGELAPAQRALAEGLLATALERRGLLKATSIMALEQVLHDREHGRGAFVRDPAAYHLTIFGEPSPQSTWGWRLEGHHLSLNLTVVDGARVVAAPAFLGAAPTTVESSLLANARVLGREEDLGFALLGSLDDNLRRVAIITDVAPEDIVAPGTQLTELPGVPAARMTDAQREILAELLDELLETLPRELGERERARLESGGLDDLVFSWAGETQPGRPHYFRISGPTFIYEFDNTQENATHAHSVWHVRAAAGGDFGVDLLRTHYQAHAHGGHR